MNPDEFALRAALGTRVRHGGTVSALSMGPPGSAVYTRWEQNLTDVSWYHSS
jgi:electron transfer flavoprotein alpha/beta subunit